MSILTILPIPTTALLLFTLLAGWVLLLLAWLSKWSTAEPTATKEARRGARIDPPPIDGESRRVRLGRFLRRHAWTLGLLAVLLVLTIFLLIFAPPRLTGEIPTLPDQPGRPFYGFRWLWTILTHHYAFAWIWTTVLGSLVSLAILGWAAIKRSRLGAEVGLLAAALTTAGLAQWTLSNPDPTLMWITDGTILYILALAGFATWGWSAYRRLSGDLAREFSLPRWLEIVFLVLILAITAYARLYAFPEIPAGIEGDETKWTAEAVNLMVAGIPDQSGEYHRDALPVSFYMQAPFHILLGPGIFAVRLEVILVSILATLLFYWLLRQIAPTMPAILAAYLLSGSIFDITASRMGNVESHVKLWPILALGLLALALRTRRWQVFAMSGIALALGLLTYDTVWPLLVVMLLVGMIALIREKRLPPREKALCFAALLFPTLLALPLLIPYALSRWGYYNLSGKGWEAGGWTTLVQNFKDVLSTWFVRSRPDFVYVRPGPIINAFLLPWLALGFTAAWFALRQRYAAWSLAWMLLFLLPVPILAASPLGRVYYPGLPAVYALVALGMYLFWQELGRVLGVLKPVAAAIFVALLVWLPIINLFIYFNKLGGEATVRLERRELNEMVSQASGEGTLLLLPIMPNTHETLSDEHQIIELALYTHLSPDQVRSHYLYVPHADLLPGLLHAYEEWERLEILLDRDVPTWNTERDQIAATLQACFPAARRSQGTYFDRYSLDRVALADPACIPVHLNLEAAGSTLHWNLSQGTAATLVVSCERAIDEVVWVEAETALPETGWRPETNFAIDWTGSGFLMDSYQAGSVSYTITLPDADLAYVWVRYYKRTLDQSPAYLSLGGQSFPFANLEHDLYNQWNWVSVGPFQIAGGPASWVLTRPFDEPATAFMSLFVDALVFTTVPAYTPDMGQPGDVLPPLTIHTPGTSAGRVELNYPSGRYRCTAEATSNMPLVDPYGNTPVRSETILLEIDR
ncbi:MAG: glycosyltransferase family 39 protein [Anaerolineales bacterium]|nr:glycosyltransferase family 39 protein [Anaerolineales bacterium]